jgi:integrase
LAKALTVKSVEAIKPSATRQEVGDAAAPGLHFVIQPSGATSWSFRYRSPLDGKPKKFTIGPYPAYGLADARKAANDLRHGIGRGVDPAEAKRAARAKAEDVSRDVDKLLDTFLARHADAKKASTAKLMRQQAETELRPAWGKRKIETITRADINDLLDGIVDRGARVQANRVFSLIRKFLSWCVDRGVINASPSAGMKRPADETARTRVLSDDELRWMWNATREAGNFGACVRLLMLLGQRRMEVGGMRRTELNFKGNQSVWIIPSSRTKNGREHTIAISALARSIIEAVPQIKESDLIFTTDGEVVSSGWSKSKRALDAAMLAEAKREVAAQGGDLTKVKIAPWSLHDLRRTCASGLAALKHPPHVIEALLNHKSGHVSGIAAVYNRYEYADEKAVALAAWEARLLLHCGGRSRISDVAN